MARKRNIAVSVKRRGTLWLYTQKIRSPFGRDLGERVYLLSNVVRRTGGIAEGTVDLTASTIAVWSGAFDADTMRVRAEAEGYEVRLA